MDKMRELFEKWAVSEGMQITRGHYYDVYASAETRAAYLAWQSAQSAAVPVVGEVVAWNYCPECGSREIRYEEGDHKQCAKCHQEWFSTIDYTDAVIANLGKRSAMAAELDALRKDAERYRWLRDGNSIQIFGVHESWTTSHRLDAVIDAAIERYANDYI